MKLLHIVGARPQFIKAAMVMQALSSHANQVLVHTGQHYDSEMSQTFFDQLDLPSPEYNLGVGSGTHAWQTAAMLEQVEKVLVKETPETCIVYGDTNSTLAGALAAVKLHIKVAHVEAGLRSFNWQMPEEINRKLVDHSSKLLFCPTQVAVGNLKNEGHSLGVHFVGDVMADALYKYKSLATEKSQILGEYGLDFGEYLLLTLHRPQNVDNTEILLKLFAAFGRIKQTIVWPCHPRARKNIKKFNIEGKIPPNLKIIEPVSYLDMLALESNASKILTDSGGVQKEAYLLKRPCITLRPETEWTETVEAGWNLIVNTNIDKIVYAAESFFPKGQPPAYYGSGDAASKIQGILIHDH